MHLFENFRRNQFRKTLIRFLSSHQRTRKITNLLHARSIAILFDATESKDAAFLVDFAKGLARDGRKMAILGFLPEKKVEGDKTFDWFNLKQVTWTGLVRPGEKTDKFLKPAYDLLLCINPMLRRPLEHLAAQTKATMKIGPATTLPNDYDIMLDTPSDKGARFFIEQLEHYLDKIVMPHESIAK